MKHIHTYSQTHTHTHTEAHTHTHTNARTHARTRAHTHPHVHTHARARNHSRAQPSTHARTRMILTIVPKQPTCPPFTAWRPMHVCQLFVVYLGSDRGSARGLRQARNQFAMRVGHYDVSLWPTQASCGPTSSRNHARVANNIVQRRAVRGCSRWLAGCIPSRPFGYDQV